MKDGEYYYEMHGLLFVVYEQVNTGMATVGHEYSKWEDEEKAKEHCRILNED